MNPTTTTKLHTHTYSPTPVPVYYRVSTYQSPPLSYIAGPHQVLEASPLSQSNHREKSWRKAEQKKLLQQIISSGNKMWFKFRKLSLAEKVHFTIIGGAKSSSGCLITLTFGDSG